MSGAPREVDYLLVGGGAASAYCASELRRRGADGSILLVGREPDPPYDRPPLSKEYLRGESSREDAFIHPGDWYSDNDVELRTAKSVLALDAGERSAKLQGGEEVRFGKALLATGAMVNILRLEGSGLGGIHYLRAFGNADKIRDDVADAEHIVMIGGSYIGCEVAASLAAMGKKCTILMLESTALSTGFGEEVGGYFQELLISQGVEVIGGAELESFEGAERVERVCTASGRTVECDAVVVGAGVRADTMLASKSGVEVGDGIICDAALQSSVEGIFAAGDVCSYESEVHGRRMRVEHWDVALQQGRHAARGMLGEPGPYLEVPYFFSDLADWASIEYVGPAREWDEIVWRGDTGGGEFTAWYLHAGRLAAALTVGRSEDLIHARRLIASGNEIGGAKGALADLDADLEAVGG